MAEFSETVIDHLVGDDWCGVSTGEMRIRNRLEHLAEKYPDKVERIDKNADGTVYYHVPFTWIKINPPRVVSDRAKEAWTETLRDARDFK